VDRILQVGINAYPSSPLNGCVNDVARWNQVFRAYGFHPDNIRAVVDDRATTENIRFRMAWAREGVEPGDTVVFQFSGHGSQVRDRNNDELADKMDEIICPVDLDWGKKMITDDEISAWARSFPVGVKLIIILDCCHSGTGTRNPHKLKKKDPRRRYLPPPLDIALRSHRRELKEFPHGFVKRKWWVNGNIHYVNEMNHLLISGCRSNQYSYDAWFGGTANGAFTHYLTELLLKQKETKIKRLHKKLLRRIRRGGYNQKPQLEGPAEWLKRPLFQLPE